MMTTQDDGSGGYERPRPSVRQAALAITVAMLVALAVLAPASALGLGSALDVPTGRILSGAADAGVRAHADRLRERAREAQRAHLFTRASALYERAHALYIRAGAARPARSCLTAIQDIFLITSTYECTRAEMLELLGEQYPGVSLEQRAAWLDLPSTESLRWDGVKHYFYDVPINLAFRDVALFQTLPAMVAAYQGIYDELVPDFVQKLSVPRGELPAGGSLRTWFPLPIEVGPQTGVSITEITPTTYLRYPPSTTQNIGLLFMRVPLQELTGDLDVSLRVRYEHAAQYFKVDPARVGRYETDGALYRRYTASRGNTQITPSIRRTARRVVGAETNPYRAANRLYDYVITNVLYSHMPHMTLWPRGQAESVYVHQRKYGD